MSEEYDPEQEMEAIDKQVGGWFDEFVGSPQYQGLTETQKEQAPDVVRCFADHAFRYVGVAPEQWNRNGVTECCVEILPRQMSADLPFFEAIAPVLSAFFLLLAEKRLLPKAAALAKTVAELEEEIVAVSQDKRHWGPANALVMAAQEAGVDMCDQRALQKFIALRNLKLLAQVESAPPEPSPPTTALPPPPTPAHRSEPKVGRNDPCACGSGKKFKKCCGA